MGKSADIVDRLKESLISIIDRYIGMKESMAFGRLTSIKAHDERYYNFPNVAATLEDKGAVVEVYERGGLKDDFPQIIYRTNNPRNKYKSTVEALEAGRKNSLKECMKNNLKARMKGLRTKMELLETSEGELKQLSETEDIVANAYSMWQGQENDEIDV